MLDSDSGGDATSPAACRPRVSPVTDSVRDAARRGQGQGGRDGEHSVWTDES